MRLDPTEGVIVFTDGSASPGDRTGGWAWVALDAFDGVTEGCGGATDTTISQMELLAPTRALNSLYTDYGVCDVLVQSDSQYVVWGFTDKSRARRLNVDFWDELERAAARHRVVMEHVKGHSGHVWNERADELAGQERKKLVVKTPESYRPTRAELVGEYLVDRIGLWVPGHELESPEVGGRSGTRRVRELRAAGFDIECRQGDGSDEWEYRLVPKVYQSSAA